MGGELGMLFSGQLKHSRTHSCYGYPLKIKPVKNPRMVGGWVMSPPTPSGGIFGNWWLLGEEATASHPCPRGQQQLDSVGY